MKTTFVTLTLLCMAAWGVYGQQPQRLAEATPQGTPVVLSFDARNDTFYISYKDNGKQLKQLVAAVDRHKEAIESHQLTIMVESYCTDLATSDNNLHLGTVRANRVKSELILRNGILEEHFTTKVYTRNYRGQASVVVVSLLVPHPDSVPKVAEESKPQPTTEPTPAPQPKPEPAPAPALQSKPEPTPQPVVEQPAPAAEPAAATVTKPYCVALRTNLLYHALLVPNLGLEWRATERLGVILDAGGSYWGGTTGGVQKLWYLNPGVRYYLGSAHRWYVGLGANYAQYNVYQVVLGRVLLGSTGYQGTLWNAGLVGGYQLPLGARFAIDVNLGLGYNARSYDSFTLVNQTRVYKDKDQTKNSIGITQAGVTLVWKIGRDEK